MHGTILLHGGGPERPQTAAADRESCMKEKHRIRLQRHHSGAAVRLDFQGWKQRAVVPLFLMVVMMAAAACGKEEVLTLRSSPSSSEDMTAERKEEASGDSGQQGCDDDAAERTGAAESAEAERNDAAESEKREPLYVYVCGAVECPGVYSFEEGARVVDAIEAAGGLSANADGACVNQARKLSDQDQLYIRTLEEKEQNTQKEELSSTGSSPAGSTSGNGYGLLRAEGSAGAEPSAADARININTASQKELTSLPGIGDTKAAAILADRTENGFYAAPEDLKRVSGIGDATFEKLRDRITTGNP